MFPLALALAIGSALVGGYNTSKTAKKQDRIAAQGIRDQAEQQRKANARMNETLKTFEESDAGSIEDELSSRYSQAMLQKRGQALAGVNGVGDAGEEWADSGIASTLARSGLFGDLAAGIDAPIDQRQAEGIERTDLGSDLGVYGRNSNAIDYLTRLRSAGVQRNPWLDILSAGMSGFAGAAGSGFGGKSGATIAGSGGQTPQQFFNQNNAVSLPGNYRNAKATPGSIFGI